MWTFLLLATLVVVLLALWFRLDCNVQLALYERFGMDCSKVLRGQIVWVIGASSGIGESLALELARCGARLILSGRRTSRLEKVKEKCMKLGVARESILVLTLDITDIDSHAAALDRVLEHFDGIDILCCNSGRFQNNYFELCDLEEERRTFDVNFFGLANLTRAVVNHWLKTERPGHICVTGSGAALSASPTCATYAASKHALRSYYESLALELYYKHIIVTVACPGPVATELWDQVSSGLVGAELVQKQPSSMSTFMAADRCARLMTVAIANRISECWLTKQPLLTLLYFTQYFKATFFWLIKRYINEKTRQKILNMQE